MNLVTLDHIHKQYSERLLLEDAGLVINRGDRIGLIGINGSGKTTLLRIVAGLEPPTPVRSRCGATCASTTCPKNRSWTRH